MEADELIEDEMSFEFESLLQKDILPQTQLLVEPSIPINTRPSILDRSFSDLVKMDIFVVKRTLIEEISSLELESNEVKDEDFIRAFKPMIDDLVKKENSSFEELSLKLLDKKHNMRDNFIKLRKVYCDTDSNDLNKGKR